MTVENVKVCPICSNASEYAWRMSKVEEGTEDNNKKLDKLLLGIIANLTGVVVILVQMVLS